MYFSIVFFSWEKWNSDKHLQLGSKFNKYLLLVLYYCSLNYIVGLNSVSIAIAKIILNKCGLLKTFYIEWGLQMALSSKISQWGT